MENIVNACFWFILLAFVVIAFNAFGKLSVNKSKTAEEDDRFLSAPIPTPPVPMLIPIDLRFRQEHEELKDGETIVAYIGDGASFVISNKWFYYHGLLFSPYDKYGEDKSRQWVLDPKNIKAFEVAKFTKQDDK